MVASRLTLYVCPPQLPEQCRLAAAFVCTTILPVCCSTCVCVGGGNASGCLPSVPKAGSTLSPLPLLPLALQAQLLGDWVALNKPERGESLCW